MFTTEQLAKIVAAEEGTRLTVLGDTITLKLSGADTDGAFLLFENINLPNHGVPTHVHELEDESFYVIEGEVEVEVDGERIRAKSGGTVFLPRGIPHSFRVVGDAPARMLVMVTPAGLENYFEEMSFLPADEPPDTERINRLSALYGIKFLPPAC